MCKCIFVIIFIASLLSNAEDGKDCLQALSAENCSGEGICAVNARIKMATGYKELRISGYGSLTYHEKNMGMTGVPFIDVFFYMDNDRIVSQRARRNLRKNIRDFRAKTPDCPNFVTAFEGSNDTFPSSGD